MPGLEKINDRVKGRITGRELLEAAIRQAQVLQYQAGEMVAFVGIIKRREREGLSPSRSLCAL